VPEKPVSEKSVGEKHGADQHVQNRKKGNQNPYPTSKKITCHENRKVIEIEDQRNFLDEVGSNEGNDEDNRDKEFLKMLHDELFHTVHVFSPVCSFYETRRLKEDFLPCHFIP
jgi:hypothetical protein